MPITIRFDRAKPMASVEFTIQDALPEYEVNEPQAGERSQIEPVLHARGFRSLIEAIRSAIEEQLSGSSFEVLRISGIVCHDVDVYRPGILLLLRERDGKETIGEQGRKRVTTAAEAVREKIGLS